MNKPSDGRYDWQWLNCVIFVVFHHFFDIIKSRSFIYMLLKKKYKNILNLFMFNNSLIWLKFNFDCSSTYHRFPYLLSTSVCFVIDHFYATGLNTWWWTLTRESQEPARTERLWDTTPTSWWRGVWWPADLWGPVLVSTCTRQIEPELELFVAIQTYEWKFGCTIFLQVNTSNISNKKYQGS